MLGLISNGLSKIFGSKSTKDIKIIMPYLEQTNAEFAKLANITDDQLRARTAEIKLFIKEKLAHIDSEIDKLNHQLKDNPEIEVQAKEDIYEQIDKLEENRNKELEDVLLDILPQAFAVVKETARRWKENGKLEVAATMHDKQIASQRAGVEIIGDTAIWHNKWLAAGTEVAWDMLHYDVQIIGGVVLHQGKIAEMATGEGKTLVSTLPAYLNALAERGVHLVTVNDYLARRDSEWMGPLYEFHGMRVDCIDRHQPNTEARRNAYMADITYGTNNEFGFDYLRDNMARSVDELVQRKHHFAMVDEVDSVLIDDARTPLIISGPVPKGDIHEFDLLKPRIQRLVEEQRKLIQGYLTEAKREISSGKEKEGGLPLFRAFRGLPKNKPLIKYLSEPGIKQILQKTENNYLQDNQRLMPEADEPLLFIIDEKHNSVNLTEKGLNMITKDGEDPNFFILPDLSTSIAQIENNKSLSDEEKANHKDQLINDYSAKTQRIHTVNQLLKAYTLFEKDVEYIVQENQVKIVDEQTGRIMDGRRYSDGLHQAIEAKENVKIEDATQTYATVTLQNYFRMYHKLSGMTGTAETEAGEFWDIYKLDVVVIPTDKPIARDDRQDLVYKTQREKFNAVAEEAVKLTAQGRPVLIGTTSVEISELLGRMLQLRGIKHNILNAKQHKREAEIVAEAGKTGQVTIATNMAGRGTDIKLSPEVKAAGGLAIIGTERHESRRVDRQLRGRAGRQGDPGSSQFYVSLEDNLMRLFGSERIAKLMDRMGYDEGEVIQHSMITKSIERAQKK
jgi:preprotein translocase subunit SecA